MKELLKHYKEVKDKAELSTWSSQRKETTDIYGDYQWEYQKEQLEIENLLYGYWKGTEDYHKTWKDYVKKEESIISASDLNALFVISNKVIFNDWLEEELKEL